MANVAVLGEIPSFRSNSFYFQEKVTYLMTMDLGGEGKGLEEKE